MERSDEARREDALYDRIGQLERTNREKAERIKQLEALIKDVRNLINTKGHVSKWKIYNWLEQEMR